MRRLITVAHGTRNPAGNAVARVITGAAAERLGVPATAAFVELAEPLIDDVMADLAAAEHGEEQHVVVPLLLSTGFHLRQDLPAAVARARGRALLGRSLGPDPAIALAQVDRLLAVGARPGQRVVLVAAGSNDEDARRDQLTAVSLLSRAWDGPVELATLSGLGARPADVVRPDDAVSPYLLAPGHFHDRIVREVPQGAVVAGVIGAHDTVIDLVCSRARDLGLPASART